MNQPRRRVGLVLVLLLICAARAEAESLSVTLLPVSVGFTLTTNSSTNQGTLPLVAVTTWTTLSVTRTAVALYAYFSSSSAALAHTNASNATDIPSSRVEVSVNGGSNQAFSQTLPFGAASAGRQIFTQSITALQLTGARTDTLALNINLSNYALAADTYVGVLRVRARATP